MENISKEEILEMIRKSDGQIHSLKDTLRSKKQVILRLKKQLRDNIKEDEDEDNSLDKETLIKSMVKSTPIKKKEMEKDNTPYYTPTSFNNKYLKKKLNASSGYSSDSPNMNLKNKRKIKVERNRSKGNIKNELQEDKGSSNNNMSKSFNMNEGNINPPQSKATPQSDSKIVRPKKKIYHSYSKGSSKVYLDRSLKDEQGDEEDSIDLLLKEGNSKKKPLKRVNSSKVQVQREVSFGDVKKGLLGRVMSSTEFNKKINHVDANNEKLEPLIIPIERKISIEKSLKDWDGDRESIREKREFNRWNSTSARDPRSSELIRNENKIPKTSYDDHDLVDERNTSIKIKWGEDEILNPKQSLMRKKKSSEPNMYSHISKKSSNDNLTLDLDETIIKDKGARRKKRESRRISRDKKNLTLSEKSVEKSDPILVSNGALDSPARKLKKRSKKEKRKKSLGPETLQPIKLDDSYDFSKQTTIKFNDSLDYKKALGKKEEKEEYYLIDDSSNDSKNESNSNYYQNIFVYDEERILPKETLKEKLGQDEKNKRVSYGINIDDFELVSTPPTKKKDSPKDKESPKYKETLKINVESTKTHIDSPKKPESPRKSPRRRHTENYSAKEGPKKESPRNKESPKSKETLKININNAVDSPTKIPESPRNRSSPRRHTENYAKESPLNDIESPSKSKKDSTPNKTKNRNSNNSNGNNNFNDSNSRMSLQITDSSPKDLRFRTLDTPIIRETVPTSKSPHIETSPLSIFSPRVVDTPKSSESLKNSRREKINRSKKNTPNSDSKNTSPRNGDRHTDVSPVYKPKQQEMIKKDKNAQSKFDLESQFTENYLLESSNLNFKKTKSFRGFKKRLVKLKRDAVLIYKKPQDTSPHLSIPYNTISSFLAQTKVGGFSLKLKSNKHDVLLDFVERELFFHWALLINCFVPPKVSLKEEEMVSYLTALYKNPFTGGTIKNKKGEYVSFHKDGTISWVHPTIQTPKYCWDGHKLTCKEGKSHGLGVFNGARAEWFRDEDLKDPAICYLWVPKEFTYVYETGHFEKKEMEDWIQTRHFLVAKNSSDQSSEWTIEGSVPIALAVLCITFFKLLS